MVRRLGLAVLVIAMVLAACGRQVTGLNTPGGGNSIQSGRMLIRFRTAAPQNFSNFGYVIVFNTSGTGIEPLPQAYQTGFLNYSFAFVVGVSPTGLASYPQLLEYYLAPGSASGLLTQAVNVPQDRLTFVPNSGGNTNGGEFDITFDRTLLYGIPGFNQSGAVPSTTAAPTAGPTTAPTTAATFVPNVQPTTQAQHVWNINFITTSPNGVPVDSMGLGGATDTTFSLQIDTTQFTDKTYTKPQVTTVADPAAQISGYEVINAP